MIKFIITIQLLFGLCLLAHGNEKVSFIVVVVVVSLITF